MSGITLHADYDRDGRLTEASDERAVRQTWPGAIVVPNLDRDQRVLPVTPSASPRPAPDFDAAVAAARDDELLPLRVRVDPGALGAAERLRIRCSGIMHTRIRLSTSNGVIVRQRLGVPEEFELPPMSASGVLDLTLQVRTIAGAAFGRLSNLNIRYRPDVREETRFTLELLKIDVLSRRHVEDVGHFTVAPVVLDDRTAPARRVYMAETPHNVPSIADMRSVLNRISVPLVRVPGNLTGGDIWLQDQYQHGVMQGARRSREIVLHLPRMRRQNSVGSMAQNLETFVAGNFRSRNVALYDDLWDRIISVNTAGGGVLRVDFRTIRDWALGARRVSAVGDQLDRYGALADPTWETRATGSFIDTLAEFAATLRILDKTIDDAVSDANPQRRDLLNGLKTAARQIVGEATSNYSVHGPRTARILRSTISGAVVDLPENTAIRLFLRALQMHSSANYGGNIESTPPLPGAPLGKIILGNAQDPDTGGDFMDPDVLRLFAKQKKQPIVELDTTWLKVGHVDEMMAVVPKPRGGFSVLHASSAAAMAILRAADAMYRSGLPQGHPDNRPNRRPSGVLNRLSTEGAHPVTRLFRGKPWRHRHRPARPGQIPTIYEPPEIYMQLCLELGGGNGYNVHDIGLVPGEGPDRRYPADITPAEIIYCESDAAGQSVNDAVDQSVLRASRTTLSDALGVPILPVPVLFDRVPSVSRFQRAHHRNTTTAFSPDCANMQIVNGHLCVPKPYGPRMRRDDAIAVVRAVMEAIEVPGSIRARVGPRLVARHRMMRERYWVEQYSGAILWGSGGSVRRTFGRMKSESDVIDGFKDSFPGASSDEVYRRLIGPNRRHFTSRGQLRTRFTPLLVNDGMVDLFELWIAAVAEEAGATVHFVDSWAYHLGDGQIHCGSNVLRRPRRVGDMDAWDAPDHEFRANIINFEADPVAAE